jgi:lipopolysaccharide heptosyltransferase II
MKKILLIQTASLGDVILATSLLETLHHCFPDAELHFMIKKGTESLFENHPFIHTLHIWDKSTSKKKSLKIHREEFKKIYFDYIINIQRFFTTGLLSVRSKAKNIIGFKKNPFSPLFTHKVTHNIGTGKHEIERNFELIKHLCSEDKPQMPKLHPSKEDFAFSNKYKTGKYYCIAPASLWYTKQFPTTKWIELINTLDASKNIFLVGGKADINICNKIIKNSKHPKVKSLCNEVSLLQLAALMCDAEMNFVNDSAPLHIASSMNASVCSIFCSTIPEFGFGPLSEKSYIIQALPEPSCKPCGLHGKKECPEKHFNCAININIKQITDIL